MNIKFLDYNTYIVVPIVSPRPSIRIAAVRNLLTFAISFSVAFRKCSQLSSLCYDIISIYNIMSNWGSALASGSFIYHNSRHLKWVETKKTKLLSNKSCKHLFIYINNK